MHRLKNAAKQIGDYFTGKRFVYSLLGLILLFAVWQIGSFFVHEIIIASPISAFSALFDMIHRPTFWEACRVTAQRAIAGIFIGGVVGFVFGIFAGLNENFKNLLEPIRWTIMSISPVIVVIIAMLWFGMGDTMVIFMASVLLSPIVYVNTMKGIEMVDENIIEMADVYRFSFFRKIQHVYIPALIGPLSAAMTVVVTNGMRIIILAEVLGTNSGIGYELSFARTDLNTPELFAWIIVTLLLVGFAEYALFKPLEDYLLRWKNKEE